MNPTEIIYVGLTGYQGDAFCGGVKWPLTDRHDYVFTMVMHFVEEKWPITDKHNYVFSLTDNISVSFIQQSYSI